jgi:hypothetical protein
MSGAERQVARRGMGVDRRNGMDCNGEKYADKSYHRLINYSLKNELAYKAHWKAFEVFVSLITLFFNQQMA